MCITLLIDLIVIYSLTGIGHHTIVVISRFLYTLDDFFFAALLEALCNNQVQAFLNICDEINFPVVPEKTVWGMVIIVFLGILFDTLNQTVSIPVDKCAKAVDLLMDVIGSRTVTVLKLQQLTGLLNFISTGVVPGRTFTRRMYCKYSFPKKKQHYRINVDRELKNDCLMWLEFLKKPEAVCRPFINFTTEHSSDVLDFFTDASGKHDHGFGCVFNPSWTYGH